MRKELILPVTAVGSGVVGFFLRRWELSTAFEGDTGLPTPGLPVTWALALLSAAVIVALALLCAANRRPFSGGYDKAFASRGNTLYMGAMTASAFLMTIGGFLLLPDLPELYLAAGTMQRGIPLFNLLPRILLAALSVLSGVSIFQLGKNGYRAEGRGKFSLWLLLPAYNACAWLIVAYQARSGDPVLLDYVYQLFAIITTVLGVYYICSFSFEKGRVFRTAFFSLAALYFIPVALANHHEPAFYCLFLAYFLFQGASMTIFLHNCTEGGRRLAYPGKSDTNREGTSDEG